VFMTLSSDGIDACLRGCIMAVTCFRGPGAMLSALRSTAITGNFTRIMLWGDTFAKGYAAALFVQQGLKIINEIGDRGIDCSDDVIMQIYWLLHT